MAVSFLSSELQDPKIIVRVRAHRNKFDFFMVLCFLKFSQT
jgi:hypothetical protein